METETTGHEGKKSPRRVFVRVVLLFAFSGGLGFFVARGDVELPREIDLEETLSAARQILGEVEERLATRPAGCEDPEKEALQARIADLEARLLAEGAQPEPAGEEHTRLARRVEFELFTTQAFDLEAVDVSAEGSVVTLRGTVRSRAERLLAVRIAENVAGVLEVVDELGAGGPGPGLDESPPSERE